MFVRFSVPFVACLFALLASVLTVHSVAAGLPMTTVEYSADRIIETGSATITGKVYAARDKQRSETYMGGMQSVMIVRQDKRVGYMLMPAQKMYQQLDFANAQKQSGSQASDQVEITEVGVETVEGHKTTKYKMSMKDGSSSGFMWITRDGIPVKMDTVSRNGTDNTRMTMTLTNLRIGAQDAALFEVPSGYTAMPSFNGGMPGTGAARGMIPRMPSNHAAAVAAAGER